MRTSPGGVVLALSLGLALAAACKASIGGPPSGSSADPPPPTTEPPPVAGAEVTPELTEARATVVALINASVVLRCDAGEAKTADDEAACAAARASMTVAAPATQEVSK